MKYKWPFSKGDKCINAILIMNRNNYKLNIIFYFNLSFIIYILKKFSWLINIIIKKINSVIYNQFLTFKK